MHALIRNAAIVLTGPLPYPTWPDPDTGRWWHMRDPEQVALAGWVEVVTQPRPDDTETTTWDRHRPHPHRRRPHHRLDRARQDTRRTRSRPGQRQRADAHHRRRDRPAQDRTGHRRHARAARPQRPRRQHPAPPHNRTHQPILGERPARPGRPDPGARCRRPQAVPPGGTPHPATDRIPRLGRRRTRHHLDAAD